MNNHIQYDVELKVFEKRPFRVVERFFFQKYMLAWLNEGLNEFSYRS